MQPNAPPIWPKTHLSLLHHLGRSITIVWPQTTPHLDSPSSLYLYICDPLRNSRRRNPKTPPRAAGHFVPRRRTMSAAATSPEPITSRHLSRCSACVHSQRAMWRRLSLLSRAPPRPAVARARPSFAPTGPERPSPRAPLSAVTLAFAAVCLAGNLPVPPSRPRRR